LKRERKRDAIGFVGRGRVNYNLISIVLRNEIDIYEKIRHFFIIE
jgi:hypothetical protein